jgi:alpha-glucoside transport system substrate-binding protein
MHRTRRWPILAATALAAAALTFSSIGTVAQDATGMAELDQAMSADQPLAGTQVTIQTQWRGGEGEGFEAAFTPFVQATGIRVVPDIIGTSHETVLRSRVEGGAPPDMAILGQPAAIIQYGQEGSLVDIASFMDTEVLAADHSALIGLYQDGDSVWGIPYKVAVKAFIW